MADVGIIAPDRNILSLKSHVCNFVEGPFSSKVCDPHWIVPENCTGDNCYLRQAGTSMSAPHASVARRGRHASAQYSTRAEAGLLRRRTPR